MMKTKGIAANLVPVLLLCSAADVAIGQYKLSGGVYEGQALDKSTPLRGVTVNLHGSNNERELETLIDTDITDASGSYELTVASLIGYPYYYIVTTPPPRHTFNGAISLGGTVRGSWIEYTPPLEGKGLAANNFWYLAGPLNQPPVVDAGPDMSVPAAELPHSVELDGLAEDPDGGPDPLMVEWSMVSGPGAADFSDPADPLTAATFHAFGIYVLRLTAFDGAGTVFDEVTIDVHQTAHVFRRSDVNFDDFVNIADTIKLLGGLFASHSPPTPCEDVSYFNLDAADTNDDGAVNIADAIYLLGFLFGGGPPPPAPYDDCGEDPTPDSLDSCYDEGLCDSYYKASSSSRRAASDPGFGLDLVARPVINGEPGTSVQFEAAVQLIKAAPGVQGWSFGITSSRPDICRIIEATSERTVAAGVDFAHTEIISRPQRPGVGVVCAAVLSRDNYENLFELPRIDPHGEPRVLLRLTLEARIPQRGSEIVTLKFVDGIRGKGQPVANILAVGGESVVPALKKVTIELSTGLVGYWNLDEGKGTTAHDSSGFGNHGTLMGFPSDPAWVEGRQCLDAADAQDDGALDLRGSGYVHCSNQDSRLDISDAITIAAWVKTDDCGNGEHNPYVTKGDHSYSLKHQQDNNIEFFIYDRGWQFVRAPGDSSFNGAWHHLAGTYDGRELRLYIDGVLQASVAHTGSIATSSHDLNIGRNSEVTDRFYQGRIDEVRIYNVALRPAEIVRLIRALSACDSNDDGVVDYKDLQIMAAEWLFDGSGGWRATQQQLAGQDIGDPPKPGSASYDKSSDMWTLVGWGKEDIWGTSDQSHYVHQPLSGNGKITARVPSLDSTAPWAKTFLMIREMLATDSKHAMMAVSVGHGAAFQWRPDVGSPLESSHGGKAAHVRAPTALRLERIGDTFTGYYFDVESGVWQQLGSETIRMDRDVYIGLAVTSHDPTKLATATVDRLWLPPYDPAGTWNARDIGTPKTGVSWYDAGKDIWTIAGRGVDICGDPDQFHYVYQPLRGDGVITARITWPRNPDIWEVGDRLMFRATSNTAPRDSGNDFRARKGDGLTTTSALNLQSPSTRQKAGLMIRETLAPNSKHAMMAVLAGQGVGFESVPGTCLPSEPSHGDQVFEVDVPVCLRIERTGDIFTGYLNSDGHWLQQGRVTIPMKKNVHIGFAVTSNDTNKLTAAQFDHRCRVSQADVYDYGEINFMDFAVLATQWLEGRLEVGRE